MTEAHFAERVQSVRALEAQEPEQWIWLSFAGEEDGFRGVVIVRAAGIMDAVSQCHRRGINPLGEVQGVELGDSIAPHPSWTYRILTREQIRNGAVTPEELTEALP